MTQIHWAQTVSGAFSDPAHWIGGVVPGASDDAILDAPGSAPYRVNAMNVTLNSIQTASHATLNFTFGTLRTAFGTGDGANAGTILITAVPFGGGADWVASGVVNNTGLIKLVAVQGPALFLVDHQSVTLTGGGRIILGDQFISAATNGLDLVYAASTLTNDDNTISGAGIIGERSTGDFINENRGVVDATGSNHALSLSLRTLRNFGLIEASGAGGMTIQAAVLVNNGSIIETQSSAMVIDTGGNTFANAGLIAVKGVGGVTIQSAVDNSGQLEAVRGTMVLNGAVSGAGQAIVAGGTLDFTSSFNERVQFLQSGGVLELAMSQSYTEAVSGFSKTGRTSLDLSDIGFVSASDATYVGTSTNGVLTVTDGTHTAQINLVGDYTASAFVASSDGHGGTDVVAESAKPIGAPPHGFISAMAGLVSPAFALIQQSEPWAIRDHGLVSPRGVTS